MNVFKVNNLWGLVRLVRDKIFTLIFFPHCRLIRTAVYIRGRRYLRFGKGFTTGVNARIDAFPDRPGNAVLLKIGDHVQLNDYVHIAAIERIEIGNHVLIASKVFISDHNHGSYSGDVQSSPLEPPAKRPLFAKPVVIEDNVWIGEMVTILPGVTIGAGSVIGAMSVVTKSVPPNSIAVGMPAQVIKRFNPKTSVWEKV